VVGVPFHNLAGGVIEANSGFVNFNRDGAWANAHFAVAQGAEVQLNAGTKTWTGTFTGSGGGTVRLGGGAQGSGAGGALTPGAGGATLNFPTGFFHFSGNATINSGGVLTNVGDMTTTDRPNLEGTLANMGTIRHSANVDFGSNGRINNLASGVYEIAQANGGTVGGGQFTTPGFFNAGTFRLTSAATSSVGVAFHNLPGGVIEATAGVLAFNTDGTWNGATFRVSAGAEVTINGGTKTWTGAFAGLGSGILRLGGGSQGSAAGGNVNVGAGGATLDFPVGFFRFSGNATLGGAAVTNLGDFTFSDRPNLEGTINNAGRMVDLANIDFGPAGRINNLAGGVFEVALPVDGGFANGSGPIPGLFNAGTLRKLGTTNASVSGVPFHNLPGGIIDVAQGQLSLNTDGTWEGASFSIAAGATLSMNAGTKLWTGTFTGSGAGNLLLSGGSQGASAGGRVNIGAAGATVNFPTGLFEFSANATIGGEGVLTNLGSIRTAGFPNLLTTLENAGTITHAGRLDLSEGAQINNLVGGVFDIAGTTTGAYFSTAGGAIGFSNSGILRKSGTAVANLSSVPVSNAGTVEVLGGTLTVGNVTQLDAGTLTGGTWRVLGGATLSLPQGFTTNAATIILDGATATFTQLSGLTTNAGSLSLLNGADLTRNGALTNSGGIVLSPESVLTVNGNFSQSGRIEFQIAGSETSGQFGRIAITGSATLGGTFAVETLGGFAPAAGEGYTLMNFASRTGNFETFEGFDQRFNPVFEVVPGLDSIRLNSLVAAPDIAVTNVAAPATGFVGKNITLSYTVTNLSNRPSTVTNWTDAIYLSRDGVLDAGDFLVSRIQHTGGLAANGTYTESVTAPVPGALEGDYQVLVVADTRRVAPDLDRANNQRLSSATIDIGIEGLALGTPASGFIAEGQDVIFQLDLASGTDVFLTSEFETPVQAEFFVKRGSLPTRTSFDFRAESLEELDQQIRLLNARAGTYYILLHGREGAGDGEEFTLRADAAPFTLDAIGQQFGANVGKVTVPLTGFGFTNALGVQLRSQDGSVVIPAANIEVVDRGHAFATFNLNGVAPGVFAVVAVQNGERLLDNAFTVQAGQAGYLEARIVVPETVRMTRPYQITVEFENRGGTDIPVPLLIVEASKDNFVWAQGQSQTQQTDTLQFLGVDPDGFSGGVLRPGEKHVVTLNAVTNGDAASFKLSSTAGDSTEIVNYAALKSSMQIAGEPPRYAAAFDRLVPELGDTYGELIQDLARAANEARRLGQSVRTFSEAFDFLIDREVLELPNANVRGTVFVDDLAHRASRPSLELRNNATGALFFAETFLDGSFSFFDVPAGTYTLEGDDFLSLSVGSLTIPQGAPVLGLNVVAQPGKTLEGRVIGSTGRAVADALVQLTDALGREFLATTDFNGRYRFGGLSPGAATIDIDAQGLVPVDDAALTVSGSEPNTRDFTLSTGGMITGRVVSPSGAPVPGAELVARLVGGSDFSQTITAGFDGRFRIGGLPAGSYEVIATADGLAAGLREQVLVGNATTTPIADLALTVGGRVFGTITDARTGQPIPGAQFQHAALGQQEAPILANVSGAYSAPNLAAGTFTTLITAPGFIPRSVELTLDAGENERYDVALRPLGAIDGVVRAAGTPAAGLELTLLQIAPGLPQEQFTVVSGRSGGFSFSGLPDGQYVLSFASAGATVSRQVFTLDSADNTHTTDLNLGGASVSGILRAADGTPLSGQPVSIFVGGEEIDTTTTSAQGHYHFLVFQSGPVDLIAANAAVGIASTLGVNVTVGERSTAPAIVAGSAGLTINVTAQTGGAAIGEALIVVRSTLPALHGAEFIAVTDASGKLILPALGPGEYKVAVSKDGFAFEQQTITVGPTSSTLDLMLDPGRVIFGTVRNAAGEPVPFAQVTAVDEATGETFLAITDAAGEYELASLPAGTFDVLLSDSGLQPLEVANVLVGQTPARVDATLSETSVSLTGVVTDTSGDPLVGAPVRLLGTGGVTLRATVTDSLGAYAFDNLAAGPVRVSAVPSGFADVTESLTLSSSSANVRNITLGEAVAAGVPIRVIPLRSLVEAPRAALYTLAVDSLSGSERAVGARGTGGDLLSGLQPPSRFDADTPGFRLGTLPEADDDCPEQVQARADAIKSARRINQAFDAYESSFEGLKALNNNDLRDIGTTVGTIAVKAGLLVAAVTKIRTAIASAAGVTGASGAFGGAAATLEANLVAVTKAGSVSEALSALSAVNVSGGATIAAFQGSAISLLGNVAADLALVTDFLKLSNQVTETVDVGLVNRLQAYEGAQDRYLDAIQKHKANRDKLDAAIQGGCGSAGDDPEKPKDTEKEDEEAVKSVGSRDPNDIIGPAGFGPQNFVANDQPLAYTIRFENVATATAAAQLVTITHQLDADVDTSAFQLGNFGFGNYFVDVPAGRDFFESRIDARDAFGVFVDVEAKIDFFTGVATWTFSAIDPETLEFTADPIAGFLPPNTAAGAGEGFVSYSIRADEATPSGTRIDAQATIVFDQNEAINTPAIFHTIDNGAPTTTVTALAETTKAPRVTLSWTGSDGAGSGVNSYDVFVSDNGGAYTKFLSDVTGTTATFRGQAGHSYTFAVLAEDNVGLTEVFPSLADATTLVSFEAKSFTKAKPLKFTDADGDKVTVTLSGSGRGSLVLDDPEGDGKGAIDQLSFAGTNAKSNVMVSVKKSGGGDGFVTIGTVLGDGALGTFNAAKSDLVLNGFDFVGAVKAIKVRDILAPEPVFGEAIIETGGTAKNKVSLTARNVADGFAIETSQTIKVLKAADIGTGEITAAALGSVLVSKGALEADITTAGAIGKLSVKRGDLTGVLSALRFGKVSVSGGDFSGTLESLATSAELKKAPALAGLTVSGGDLTGDLRVLGAAGKIVIETAKRQGGNVTGASIVAAKIAELTIAGNLAGSTILAGGDLGSDHALGGTGTAADTFLAGAIGKISISRGVTATLIGAGFSTEDAVLKNEDDEIINRAKSTIASLIIKREASADSYFAAGQFTAKPKIDGATVNPNTSPLFLVG